MTQPSGHSDELLVDHDGPVTVLTLNRPHARNALTLPMMRRLLAALDEADRDPEVRAVVLTGAGASFSVGIDLSAGEHAVARLIEQDADGRSEQDYREPAGRVSLAIHAMRIPVIAAVNGDAVGGGATILLAADARFAADTARFGFVFTRRGLSPEGGSTWLLPRIVGITTATDWLVSGRIVQAGEAHAAGLLTGVHPGDQVLARALDHAHRIAGNTGRVAVAAVRRLLAASATGGLDAAVLRESATISELAETPDAREAITAFLQHRRPDFTTSVAPYAD